MAARLTLDDTRCEAGRPISLRRDHDVRRLIAIALATILTSACGSSYSVPRYYPIPEGARNPIVLRYSGATVEEIVGIVTQMSSDVPVAVAQVVPEKGYVETRWTDVASFNLGMLTDAYPLEERLTVYAFQVSPSGENAGTLQIAGWYQPNRPPSVSRVRDSYYDRFIPTDHPGYQIMLQFEWRLRNRYFPERGITLVGMDEQRR